MESTSHQNIVLIAPFFFGVIWNWFLLGMLFLQLYIYTLRRRKDRVYIKALVTLIIAMDLTETGLSTHGAYQVLVQFWGMEDITIHAPKTFILLPMWDALIASFVQSFFAWRIWVMGSRTYRKFLAPFIFILALLQSAGALVATVLEEGQDNQLSLSKVNKGYLIWLVTNVIVDVVIAATMITILRDAKSASHFSNTQTILSKLMRQVVTTGAITATIVSITLGLFVHKNMNNFFATPGYILGKLYSNSLIANLNARPDEIDKSSTGHSTSESHELSAINRSRFRSSRSHKSSTGIRVETVQDTRRDSFDRMTMPSDSDVTKMTIV